MIIRVIIFIVLIISSSLFSGWLVEQGLWFIMGPLAILSGVAGGLILMGGRK